MRQAATYQTSISERLSCWIQELLVLRTEEICCWDHLVIVWSVVLSLSLSQVLRKNKRNPTRTKERRPQTILNCLWAARFASLELWSRKFFGNNIGDCNERLNRTTLYMHRYAKCISLIYVPHYRTIGLSALLPSFHSSLQKSSSGATLMVVSNLFKVAQNAANVLPTDPGLLDLQGIENRLAKTRAFIRRLTGLPGAGLAKRWLKVELYGALESDQFNSVKIEKLSCSPAVSNAMHQFWSQWQTFLSLSGANLNVGVKLQLAVNHSLQFTVCIS